MAELQSLMEARICALPLDEFVAGPGGFTSIEVGGAWYVSEDQYLYASDFAYCAIDRLEPR